MNNDETYDRAKQSRPTDKLLRAGGFKIADRPEGGEPIWRRGKYRYTESEAWRLLNAEKVGKRRGYQV